MPGAWASFYLLVTPRTHILHHAINERYINRNFGAMFCVWDRLFGTHVELGLPWLPGASRSEHLRRAAPAASMIAGGPAT